MRMVKTYHIDVWMPEALLNAVLALPLVTDLRYSKHALHAALSDRYGPLKPNELPRQLDISRCQVIEAESDRVNIFKVVLRKSLDSYRDMIMVVLLCPEFPGQGLVKTVWVNLSNDLHNTLNRAKYAQPAQGELN